MPKKKSGTYWVTWANAHATTSKSINDLEVTFKAKVKAFIKALQDAGASVTVNATMRNSKRAYLFHWSWKIAQGKVKASAVPAMQGVDIEWDHGTDKDSKKGANDMVSGFGLAVPPVSNVAPSLTSNHISGKAIDMTISWKGKIKVAKKDGSKVEITYMSNVNLNSPLQKVGESYGVRKLTSDAPHWSFNGR
jgi:hypothetical protein